MTTKITDREIYSLAETVTFLNTLRLELKAEEGMAITDGENIITNADLEKAIDIIFNIGMADQLDILGII